MKKIEDEYMCEEKMDQITFYLEEIVLDALLAVLKNLRNKNDLLSPEIAPHKNDDIEF